LWSKLKQDDCLRGQFGNPLHQLVRRKTNQINFPNALMAKKFGMNLPQKVPVRRRTANDDRNRVGIWVKMKREVDGLPDPR
jgi:hypothetical protein